MSADWIKPAGMSEAEPASSPDPDDWYERWHESELRAEKAKECLTAVWAAVYHPCGASAEETVLALRFLLRELWSGTDHQRPVVTKDYELDFPEPQDDGTDWNYSP